MKDYNGGWHGQFAENHSLVFSLVIEQEAKEQFLLKVFHQKKEINRQSFSLDSDQNFQVPIADGIQFAGRYKASEKAIDGFIQTMVFQYYLSFSNNKKGRFVADWKPWTVDQLEPTSVYLVIDNGEKDQYEAYPFFDEARFTGTFAGDFQKNKEEILFIDGKSGLSFKGLLMDKKIKLSLLLGEYLIMEANLESFEGNIPQGHDYAPAISRYEKPQKRSDGLSVRSLKNGEVNKALLEAMVDSITAKKLTYTHSILVAKNNQLVYEKYFYGYHPEMPHDMRSAQKSISSAMLGITIRDGLIRDTRQPLYHFIPDRYQYTKKEDVQKDKITLHDVLSMSSGLDAIDYGLDRQSAASEGAYQSTPDWTKTILEAPMVNPPGKEANYGSGNPHLIGVVVNQVIPQPLNFYMNDQLFKPLGVKNYVLQNDRSGTPYFGGGMYLTSRSFLKFGLLYSNNGVWNEKRILPKTWIDQSFQKHGFLANDSDKNEYGYFWWHDTYEVGDKKVASIEARGAGGQYIFVIPAFDMVIVITSGNYRNGRFWQPELIVEDYILPAFIH